MMTVYVERNGQTLFTVSCNLEFYNAALADYCEPLEAGFACVEFKYYTCALDDYEKSLTD